MNGRDESHRHLARVAAIPEQERPFELVINKGRADGVEEKNEYLVFGLGNEILDPETHQSLGKLEIVRGRGIVTHVQDRLATLRCIDVETVYGETKRRIRENTGSMMAALYGPRIIEETTPAEHEKLPFRDPQIGDFARPI